MSTTLCASFFWEETLLYFAYTARISPEQMAEVSSDATFEFIAHMAEWGLEFPLNGNGWGGALPSAIPTEGATVWGAVHTIPDTDVAALDAVEADEGRAPRSVEVIDRSGRRHSVMTHVAGDDAATGLDPSLDYVQTMLSGSRHWQLPAGWIVGLEEHLGSEF